MKLRKTMYLCVVAMALTGVFLGSFTTFGSDEQTAAYQAVESASNNRATLLQIVKDNETTLASFDGECNRFVKAQLDYYQVASWNETPHAGGRIWTSKVDASKSTSYGYNVEVLSGSNSWNDFLAMHPQPIYNVVVSYGDSGWGHCVYIHAIIGDEVFFMDNWTYRGSSLVKYKPVRMDKATFNKCQVESNGTVTGVAYYYKDTQAEIRPTETSTVESKYPIDTTDERVKQEWTKNSPYDSTPLRGKGSDTGIYFKAVNGTLPGNGFRIRVAYENGTASDWFHITDSNAYVVNNNVSGQANQLVWLETWYPKDWGYNWGDVTIDWSPDFTPQSGVTELY